VIAFDEANGSSAWLGLTASAASFGVLYQSTDGGDTFEATSAPIGHWLPNGVAIRGSSSPTVNGVAALGSDTFVATADGLIATSDGGTTWVYRSADGGTTFSFSYNGASTSPVVIAPSNDDVVHGPIESTTDGGATWRPLGLFDYVIYIPAPRPE